MPSCAGDCCHHSNTHTAMPQSQVKNKKVPESSTYLRVEKPRVEAAKVETREPDCTVELRRGNMKEKWGLGLVFSIESGRLELVVNKGKL